MAGHQKGSIITIHDSQAWRRGIWKHTHTFLFSFLTFLMMSSSNTSSQGMCMQVSTHHDTLLRLHSQFYADTSSTRETFLINHTLLSSLPPPPPPSKSTTPFTVLPLKCQPMGCTRGRAITRDLLLLAKIPKTSVRQTRLAVSQGS